jgi:hypothetical protein
MSENEDCCWGCEDAHMLESLSERHYGTIHNAVIYSLSEAARTYVNPDLDDKSRHQAYDFINHAWHMLEACNEDAAQAALGALPGVDEATDGICPSGYDDLQAQIEGDLDAELAGMNAGNAADLGDLS